MPRHDEATGGEMHGFLNVLVAMALIEAHDLTRGEIEQVLTEKDPRAFEIFEDSVSWKKYQANMEAVESVRGIFVSYGSCSVEEPLEDLEEMGLLEGVKR
jgi:hypothetical protein